MSCAGALPVGLYNRRAAMFYQLFAIMLFFSFHTGIRLTMNIGLFSVASIVFWIALIPGDFWDLHTTCCLKQRNPQPCQLSLSL